MELEKLYQQADTANRMAEAATAFLASLGADQRSQAALDFADESNRKDWHYIPRDRQGVSLKELDETQREKVFALVDTGLSESARAKARTIISLEPILGKIEGPGRKWPRESGLYNAMVFGTPGDDDPWSWRFEGHHLSLNFTIANRSMVAPTPIFFGSNPAEVRHGESKGLRALKEEEEMARDLLTSLDGEQKKVAIINGVAPADILTRNATQVTDEVSTQGIQGKDLSSGQRELMHALLKVYVHRLPDEIADTEWGKVESADVSDVHFAWAGPEERNKGHYYNVYGPTFLAEYDNTQNDANHIHSVWRDLTNDFGGDILKQHYERSH